MFCLWPRGTCFYLYIFTGILFQPEHHVFARHLPIRAKPSYHTLLRERTLRTVSESFSQYVYKLLLCASTFCCTHLCRKQVSVAAKWVRSQRTQVDSRIPLQIEESISVNFAPVILNFCEAASVKGSHCTQKTRRNWWHLGRYLYVTKELMKKETSKSWCKVEKYLLALDPRTLIILDLPSWKARNTDACESSLPRYPRAMNVLCGQVPQLWQPSSHIVTRWIHLHMLRQNWEKVIPSNVLTQPLMTCCPSFPYFPASIFTSFSSLPFLPFFFSCLPTI